MATTRQSSSAQQPYACVIGDLSMVRALGRAGIPVALVTDTLETRAVHSRYTKAIVQTPSWVDDPDAAVDALIEWGKQQAEAPILFYQGDHDLVALSKARERLVPHFRFIFPPQELVADFSDKLRFADLVEQRELPVPRTLTLKQHCNVTELLADWDDFPCVFKPAMRTNWYETIGCLQKALRIESRAELDELIPKIDVSNAAFVLQASIEGGEENIVSYHAYIRPGGEIVAEFTGQKVRTGPRLYGISSCVEITDDERVRSLGRSVVEKLDFSGVLKIDFKIDSRSGELFMLEINPRFNLWHHPAAVAGVNIPQAVYQDCIEAGSAKVTRTVRPGVRWIEPGLDFMAYREYHADGDLPLLTWLRELATADVNEGFSWRDPKPGILGIACRIKRNFHKRVLRRQNVAECG